MAVEHWRGLGRDKVGKPLFCSIESVYLYFQVSSSVARENGTFDVVFAQFAIRDRQLGEYNLVLLCQILAYNL